MAAHWFVTVEGREFGPLTDAQLIDLVRASKVGPYDLVRRIGGPSVAAGAVPGLFPVTRSLPSGPFVTPVAANSTLPTAELRVPPAVGSSRKAAVRRRADGHRVLTGASILVGAAAAVLIYINLESLENRIFRRGAPPDEGPTTLHIAEAGTTDTNSGAPTTPSPLGPPVTSIHPDSAPIVASREPPISSSTTVPAARPSTLGSKLVISPPIPIAAPVLVSVAKDDGGPSRPSADESPEFGASPVALNTAARMPTDEASANSPDPALWLERTQEIEGRRLKVCAEQNAVSLEGKRLSADQRRLNAELKQFAAKESNVENKKRLTAPLVQQLREVDETYWKRRQRLAELEVELENLARESFVHLQPFGPPSSERGEAGVRYFTAIGKQYSEKGEPIHIVHAGFGRACAHSLKGDSLSALEDFNSVVKMQPRNGMFLAIRGVAKVRSGNDSGGREDLMTAVKNSYGNDKTFARYLLAVTLMFGPNSSLQGAETHLREAMKADADDPDVLRLMGLLKCACSDERFRKADYGLTNAQRAHELAPTPAGRLVLAAALADNNRFEEAVLYAEKAASAVDEQRLSWYRECIASFNAKQPLRIDFKEFDWWTKL